MGSVSRTGLGEGMVVMHDVIPRAAWGWTAFCQPRNSRGARVCCSTATHEHISKLSSTCTAIGFTARLLQSPQYVEVRVHRPMRLSHHSRLLQARTLMTHPL